MTYRGVMYLMGNRPDVLTGLFTIGKLPLYVYDRLSPSSSVDADLFFETLTSHTRCIIKTKMDIGSALGSVQAGSITYKEDHVLVNKDLYIPYSNILYITVTNPISTYYLIPKTTILGFRYDTLF